MKNESWKKKQIKILLDQKNVKKLIKRRFFIIWQKQHLHNFSDHPPHELMSFHYVFPFPNTIRLFPFFC